MFQFLFKIFGSVSLPWVLALLLTTSCANIQPPMGGPRDSIPPVLIKANPLENSVNFTTKSINFQFNEYIQVSNIYENLIINPPAEKYPVITSKLRNLTIKIKDTLQPNTTYTFNFGNAITDVNEGIPFKNFSYSFSTGNYIDSLELSGKLINAETGLPDSSILVILHTNPSDSAVAKLKPRFVTRPNGQGIFRFDHLPNDSFYVFALKDEGLKKYTSNQLEFAFNDRMVHTLPPDTAITLRYFVGEKPDEKKTAAPKPKDAKEENRLRFSLNIETGGADILTPLRIRFEKPVTQFDISKLLLTDTLFQPIALSKFEWDSTNSILSLPIAWKEDFSYKLLALKGFAAAKNGITTNKNDTLSFKAKAEKEYGSLKVAFKGLQLERHPLLLWLENNQIIKSIPLTSDVYQVKWVQPGSFKFRIVLDQNQNGQWDTGDYWKKLQPEWVVPIEETFNIKASWENEFEIIL